LCINILQNIKIIIFAKKIMLKMIRENFMHSLTKSKRLRDDVYPVKKNKQGVRLPAIFLSTCPGVSRGIFRVMYPVEVPQHC
jgi:hypothetical protein